MTFFMLLAQNRKKTSIRGWRKKLIYTKLRQIQGTASDSVVHEQIMNGSMTQCNRLHVLSGAWSTQRHRSSKSNRVFPVCENTLDANNLLSSYLRMAYVCWKSKKEEALLWKTKEVDGGKIACYSQALELDIELLHLHFLPRIQLKRRRKKRVNNIKCINNKCSNCMVKEQKRLVIVI